MGMTVSMSFSIRRFSLSPSLPLSLRTTHEVQIPARSMMTQFSHITTSQPPTRFPGWRLIFLLSQPHAHFAFHVCMCTVCVCHRSPNYYKIINTHVKHDMQQTNQFFDSLTPFLALFNQITTMNDFACLLYKWNSQQSPLFSLIGEIREKGSWGFVVVVVPYLYCSGAGWSLCDSLKWCNWVVLRKTVIWWDGGRRGNMTWGHHQNWWMAWLRGRRVVWKGDSEGNVTREHLVNQSKLEACTWTGGVLFARTRVIDFQLRHWCLKM